MKTQELTFIERAAVADKFGADFFTASKWIMEIDFSAQDRAA